MYVTSINLCTHNPSADEYGSNDVSNGKSVPTAVLRFVRCIHNVSCITCMYWESINSRQRLNNGNPVPPAMLIRQSDVNIPQTEEIGIKIITTANISNKISRESPYLSNTFYRESPKFQKGFQVSKWSPCHSKE